MLLEFAELHHFWLLYTAAIMIWACRITKPWAASSGAAFSNASTLLPTLRKCKVASAELRIRRTATEMRIRLMKKPVSEFVSDVARARLKHRSVFNAGLSICVKAG